MNHVPFVKQTKIDRILIVDDSPDNIFLIQSILQEGGYAIETAENGEEALSKIEEFLPDLILLDVMMPRMDGYEVTHQVRNNVDLPFIPILLITAYDQLSVARGLDMGADDFIRKPVEYDELMARVRSLLRLKHSVAERDQIASQREDLVGRLTHDLRTPMVAADRMLNLLAQGVMGELSSDVQEAIEIMSRSNQSLLTMVNMLLEVYRYEAGRKALIFSPVDLTIVAREVVEELSPIAIDKGLVLELLEAPVGPLLVKSDRMELYRVIMNLVGNAVKFTDRGRVTLKLTTNSGALLNRNTALIGLEVKDTGAGIPVDEQAMLFERFVTGKHNRSGSGLGLYLTRRIVEAHNGEIKINSTVGVGSTFTVLLPSY